jgi:hypothetical protein
MPEQRRTTLLLGKPLSKKIFLQDFNNLNQGTILNPHHPCAATLHPL